MKRTMMIMIILAGIFLSSCQNRLVIYTSEDAAKYALQKAKTTQATMIGVKQKNGDTIWTFQESYERGLIWQTIDHHYMDSLSINECNELVSNYDLRVIAYYFQKYPDLSKDVSISYTYLDTYPFSVIYHDTFTTRESLKQSYDALFAFLDYVKQENADYSDKSKEYEVQADFKNQNKHFVFDSLNASYEALEQQYLTYIMVYHETESMNEFSETEIQKWKEAADTKIYMKLQEDDPWKETEYYCEENEMKIASTALYDLLQAEETDIQIEGERDSFTILNEEETYGPFERETLSFVQVQQMTGIYFTNDTNVIDAAKESDVD